MALVYRTTSLSLTPRSRVITDISAFFGIENVDVIALNDQVKAGELYNLLSTAVGDDPGLPTYGCDLPRRVFAPISAALTQELILDVYLSSKQWLPDVPVLPNESYVVASAANRTAGVTVAYVFGGERWHLPVTFMD